MSVTEVVWTRDHHGKPVLELKLDGHPAYVRSSQRTALLDRGIVEGMVFLASERRGQPPDAFMRGDREPEHPGRELAGCTDDPDVLALFHEMCAAIRDGTWREGARP